MKKMIKYILYSILFFCVFIICIVSIARIVNANKTKIRTPNGIQESTYVNIGGIEQYVQIRGEDIGNPVILWLHGGPGFPLSYLSYYYQTELEGDYTIVCWEQRGCGRTYYKNNNDELSMDLILRDTDEMVDYLLQRFEKEKIIIIGQSWGTVIGTSYIKENPEKVSAYIGVGQVIDFDMGKVYAAKHASDMAKEKENLEDAETLDNSITVFREGNSIDELNIKNLENMITLSLKYLKGKEEMSGIKQMWVGVSSPNMSIDDFRWFIKASSTEKILDLEKPLIDYMYYKFDEKKIGDEFENPICFIQGSNDWITPTGMVLQYYNTLNAPYKKITLIKDTGHTPFLDNPSEFCNAVKEFLSNINLKGGQN